MPASELRFRSFIGQYRIADENEVDPVPAYRISSFCHASGCVAVAVGHDEVSVRSSIDPEGPVLSFTADEWTAFVAGVRNGEFDLPVG